MRSKFRGWRCEAETGRLYAARWVVTRTYRTRTPKQGARIPTESTGRLNVANLHSKDCCCRGFGQASGLASKRHHPPVFLKGLLRRKTVTPSEHAIQEGRFRGTYEVCRCGKAHVFLVPIAVKVGVLSGSVDRPFFGQDLVQIVQLFSGVEHRVRFAPLCHPSRIDALLLVVLLVAAVLYVRTDPEVGVLVHDVLNNNKKRSGDRQTRQEAWVSRGR